MEFLPEDPHRCWVGKTDLPRTAGIDGPDPFAGFGKGEAVFRFFREIFGVIVVIMAESRRTENRPHIILFHGTLDGFITEKIEPVTQHETQPGSIVSCKIGVDPPDRKGGFPPV